MMAWDHSETDLLTFINAITDDMTYTLEHPSHDGTIPYLDILIYPDNSTYSYHSSLDVQSLYTSCDMRLAMESAISSFDADPSLLPSNLTSSTIRSLITFCLDNRYLEFNGNFYSQTVGGPMGSPARYN